MFTMASIGSFSSSNPFMLSHGVTSSWCDLTQWVVIVRFISVCLYFSRRSILDSLWCLIFAVLMPLYLFCTAKLSPYMWQDMSLCCVLFCNFWVIMANAVWPLSSPLKDDNSMLIPSTAPPPLMLMVGSLIWSLLDVVMIHAWLQLPTWTVASLAHIAGVLISLAYYVTHYCHL